MFTIVKGLKHPLFISNIYLYDKLRNLSTINVYWQTMRRTSVSNSTRLEKTARFVVFVQDLSLDKSHHAANDFAWYYSSIECLLSTYCCNAWTVANSWRVVVASLRLESYFFLWQIKFRLTSLNHRVLSNCGFLCNWWEIWKCKYSKKIAQNAHVICILADTYFKNTHMLSTRHHFSKLTGKLFFSIYHLINTYNSPRAEKSLICVPVEPINFTQEELYTVSF